MIRRASPPCIFISSSAPATAAPKPRPTHKRSPRSTRESAASPTAKRPSLPATPSGLAGLGRRIVGCNACWDARWHDPYSFVSRALKEAARYAGAAPKGCCVRLRSGAPVRAPAAARQQGKASTPAGGRLIKIGSDQWRADYNHFPFLFMREQDCKHEAFLNAHCNAARIFSTERKPQAQFNGSKIVAASRDKRSDKFRWEDAANCRSGPENPFFIYKYLTIRAANCTHRSAGITSYCLQKESNRLDLRAASRCSRIIGSNH